MEMGKDAVFVAPEVEPTITATGGIRSALRRGAKQAAPAPIQSPVEAQPPIDLQPPAEPPQPDTPVAADEGVASGPDSGAV
jgi:hypothetical protein